MLTLTTIGTILTFLFFFASAISVYISWKKSPELEYLEYFAISLFLFSIQQALFSLIGVISKDPFTNHWLWIFSHFFAFAAVTFFLRFIMRIKAPRYEKIVFRTMAFLSIIGADILLFDIPNFDAYFLNNMVYVVSIPPLTWAVIGIFMGSCLVLSFLLFAVDSLKVENKVLRTRSMIMAGGILFFTIGEPLHNLAETPFAMLAANSLMMLGAFLIMMATYLFKTPIGNHIHKNS